MIVFYHVSDLDGVCSAAIVKIKFPNAKLIGLENDEPFDISVIRDNETVFMVDIGLPMDIMEAISNKTDGNFTWIDHHKSRFIDYNNYKPFKINANLDSNLAACELTWKTLFPEIPVPIAVQLLGAYDVWDKSKFDWDKVTVPFQYGMRLDCGVDIERFNPNIFKINFETGSYDNLFQVIYNSGITVLEYQREQNELHAKRQWFETDILGYKAICINDNTHSSSVFDTVYDEDKHDLMVLFYYVKDGWKFSFYTIKDNVDCSLIAKSFGGGGHKKAAGCKVNNLSKVFTNKEF